MLVPNPSQAEDSLSPPPYTPTSSSSADPPRVPLESTLRGGDAHPSVSVNDHHFPSAASYFNERPFTVQYPNHILHQTLVFSPNATRDDFPFPQPDTQYRSRDVSVHDWDTFLNYLLPPDLGPVHSKDRLSRPRGKDALRDQDRIETVLAEWHEGFFGPRGIQIEAIFPASSYVNASPPPPFTSTADIGYYPEANGSTSRNAPFPSGPPRLPMPSQPSMPSQPPMPHAQSPLQWARNNIIGPRLGSIPLARLLSNNRDQQPVRLPTPDTEVGATIIVIEEDIMAAGVAVMADTITAVALLRPPRRQVRHSIAALRQNADRKAHLSATIRHFKNEIRQSRRQLHVDNTHGMRTSLKRENSRELKAQGKELKAELKGFIKEARALRKADRKMRKAERKGRRAERRAKRRGMDARDEKSRRKVAKAETKALKAQRRVVEAHEMARARAVDAGGKARRAQEDGVLLYDGERDNAHTRGNEFEADDRVRDRELAESTRSLGLSDTKGQETGVVDKEE
ncbi:MAG: hypothetical protein Q9201_005973 [Fulgogasparrea decipioides]